MADNTDEEHLYNPTKIQSENPSDEITPTTTDTDAINPNQETENMEVHHHAHHGGKKNWKSYFWEFLMLFLAVFCGFLAEYQLEHIFEREREKELASNFYRGWCLHKLFASQQPTLVSDVAWCLTSHEQNLILPTYLTHLIFRTSLCSLGQPEPIAILITLIR